ncbi:hypothetical protein K0M31_016130 [Melipona bicolor]|uniref:Uncharacterized protein n=1 Tax=Melipona bicolor TaxID=60889 RepID=A0AA40G765_9HYME|nr:hypothetical protein K0M31_016130 [Melipona bicolor]
MPQSSVTGKCSFDFYDSLHQIESTVNQYTYKDILEKNLLEIIENMPVPECDVFQHDNASGYCAKSVKNLLQTQPFQTMEWPA